MNKLVAVIKRLLNIDREDLELRDAAEASSATAAVPGRHEPRALHRGRRRLKENYTSHWDLDYLPRGEMEKIIAESERKRS